MNTSCGKILEILTLRYFKEKMADLHIIGAGSLLDFLDVGLVKRACNLGLELIFNEDLMLINDGALAEQFVGQEFLAYFQKDEINGLYAWKRKETGSSAELDFLTAVDTQIVPIEVKAGATGTLKSLRIGHHQQLATEEEEILSKRPLIGSGF